MSDDNPFGAPAADADISMPKIWREALNVALFAGLPVLVLDLVGWLGVPWAANLALLARFALMMVPVFCLLLAVVYGVVYLRYGVRREAPVLFLITGFTFLLAAVTLTLPLVLMNP